MRKIYLLCWLLLASVAALAQRTPSDFKLEKILGTPVGFPNGVAVDGKGFIYILESNVVTKLDAEGTYVGQIAVGSPDPAKRNAAGYGLTLDTAGNLYVVDFGYAEVRKFSPSGQLLLAFPTGAYTSSGASGILNPEAIAVDLTGNIYVVGDTPAGGLRKFDPQGKLLWEFTAPGNTSSTFVYPKDVVVDKNGQVWLLTSNFTVCQISAAGQLERQVSVRISQYNERTDTDALLALDAAGNFYTTISQGNSIRKFDSAGTFLGYIGSNLGGSTRTALACGPDGSLYATTRDHGGSSRLYKYNAAGAEVGRWGNLATVSSVVQDKAGHIYAAIGGEIIKRDATGRELARFGGFGTGPGQVQGSISSLACDAQGNVYALDGSGPAGRVYKYTSQGQYLSTTTSPHFASQYGAQLHLAVDAVGNLYVNDYFGDRVRKISPQGVELLQFGVSGRNPGQLSRPRAIAIDERGFVYVADISGYRVQKFTSTGVFLRESSNVPPYDTITWSCTASLTVDAGGTVFLGTSLESVVRVFDPSGRFSRQLPFMSSNLSVNPQGTRLLRTYSDVIQMYGATNPITPPSSLITGRIFQDLTYTCNPQASPALAGIPVVAEPGNYYGYSDENGTYSIAADTGTYTVRQLLPQEPGRTIRPTCATTQTVRVSNYGATVKGPDFGNQVTTAPYLSVEVASDRRRRCFRNQTTVAYANTGFAAAANAKVTVELPEHVLFISATAPHTRNARGQYVFDVGTLQPNQRGSIRIQDSVACGNPAIRGLTVCTKAWIKPANTYPTSPDWNTASISVSGSAQAGNQARFTITNTGRGATTDSLSLRVYQDTHLALTRRYALGATDSLVLRVPATGRVVRVEADQPPGHPLKTLASATVELPGRVTDGQPSAAMPAFPPDEAEPEKAVDCQPILDSYDPNDKQVVPAGLTDQHYTPTNTPLQYQVRFQNTGNDVAYWVQVVDTLAADLDLSTLRIGAVSHPYRFSITGQTRPVLTFTFANILLPDSARNPADSNGFVQFSIQPKAGLAPKTRIENFADIYFDYNEPVRTNTTLNRLFDLPPTVDPAYQLAGQDVVVSPSISSFAPLRGRAGTVVTLTGHHFAAASAANQVLVGGQPAPVVSATPTMLTVRVPAGAASGPLQVLTPVGSARSATSFTFLPAPVITGFAPTEGPAGTLVTLTGRHFGTEGQADTVYFQGQAAEVVSRAPERLVARVPLGARTGPISVAGVGGVGQSGQAFVVPALTATGAGAAAQPITVYPNPTAGEFTVDWQQAAAAVQQVRVFNALGRLVLHQTLGARPARTLLLSLAAYPPGLYVVVLGTSHGTIKQRLTLL